MGQTELKALVSVNLRAYPFSEPTFFGFEPHVESANDKMQKGK